MSRFSDYVRIGAVPGLLIFLSAALRPLRETIPSAAAVVTHECGHLLAARLLNIRLRRLDVSPMGAVIRVRGSMLSYGREAALSAAGPAANLLTAAAAGLLPESGYAAEVFCAVSVMLALLNLLPVEGFDGGRILSCAVGALAGPSAAYRTLKNASFVSVCGMWLISVYLLLTYGASLSLFVFAVSVFRRVFIEERSGEYA